jgi:hypothetical protein
MAFTPHSGNKAVTASGTAERLVSSTHAVQVLYITAKTNNTGIISVGDSATIAIHTGQNGCLLLAGDTITLFNIDMYDIYIDASVSGESVVFTWQE